MYSGRGQRHQLRAMGPKEHIGYHDTTIAIVVVSGHELVLPSRFGSHET
jgi:hypothetical protein